MEPRESQGKETWETLGSWLESNVLSSLGPWYRFCVIATQTWVTKELTKYPKQILSHYGPWLTCSSCWMEGTTYNCVALPYSRHKSSLVSPALSMELEMYGLSSASILPTLKTYDLLTYMKRARKRSILCKGLPEKISKENLFAPQEKF